MNARQLYACRVDGDDLVAAGFRFRLPLDNPPDRAVALAASLTSRGELQVELFAKTDEGLEPLGRFPAQWATDDDPVAVGDLIVAHVGPFGLLRFTCPLRTAIADMIDAGTRGVTANARAVSPDAIVREIEKRARAFDLDGYDALARAARVIFPPEADVPTTADGEPVH